MWDALTENQAVKVFETGDAKEESERLVKTALGRDSKDNISVVVVAL